ncbi:hypothetical protein CGMCC3_g2363 [Colletotrichum fructicola]|nr:uncharacterized protein CGMCC3_g2363 [Colletotrichum fructicola]KAE9581620.1 hypothetical protein CGMCC3_g2363 [Colletotrichum fructicola]
MGRKHRVRRVDDGEREGGKEKERARHGMLVRRNP